MVWGGLQYTVTGSLSFIAFVAYYADDEDKRYHNPLDNTFILD